MALRCHVKVARKAGRINISRKYRTPAIHNHGPKNVLCAP